jgi:hypothetical protein
MRTFFAVAVLLVFFLNIFYFMHAWRLESKHSFLQAVQQESLISVLRNKRVEAERSVAVLVQEERKRKKRSILLDRISKLLQHRNEKVTTLSNDYSVLHRDYKRHITQLKETLSRRIWLGRFILKSLSADNVAPKQSFASPDLPLDSLQFAIPGRSDNTVTVNRTELIHLIHLFNAQSPWRNIDRFRLEPDFVPIVMRVNRRVRHLSVVLQRLERVVMINRTILIVSHDSIDPDVIRIIGDIKFMIVKQIINPQSSNVLLDRFPGTDEVTMSTRDRHNHTRSSGTLPGMKHHFLWHLSFAWRRLLPARVRDVLLIEEDHVPTFDFYVAARGLLLRAEDLCPNCGGNIVAGHHMSGSVIATPFEAFPLGFNVNMGLSCSRTFWQAFLQHSQTWCHFDDYNWDMSLEHLRAIGNLPPYYLSMAWSRLLHVGICGSTHASTQKSASTCSAAEAQVLARIDNEIEPKLSLLYDEALQKTTNLTIQKRNLEGVGSDALDIFVYDSIRQQGITPELSASLFVRSTSTRPVPSRNIPGFGGYGPIDQQFCDRLAAQ